MAARCSPIGITLMPSGSDVVILPGSGMTGLIRAVGALGESGLQRYCVIGGVAVTIRLGNAHRATADVDTVVDDTTPPDAVSALLARSDGGGVERRFGQSLRRFVRDIAQASVARRSHAPGARSATSDGVTCSRHPCGLVRMQSDAASLRSLASFGSRFRASCSGPGVPGQAPLRVWRRHVLDALTRAVTWLA